MRKKLIILLIIFISIVVILVIQIPKWQNKSKFEKIFNDSSILTSGYTYYGLSYLNIRPNSFNLEYTERDIGNVKGRKIEIKGTVKVKDLDTLLLTYDNNSINCSILNFEVLDCNGDVFRRYDVEYNKSCELEIYAFADVINAGVQDGFYNNPGASYNNPYEKTDPCYQEYDSNYHRGLFNGYERSARSEQAFEEAMKKENGCLGLGGQCYNISR